MRRAAIACVLFVAVLAGCSAPGRATKPTHPSQVDTASAPVDTPALRKLKQKAGIEDCPHATQEPNPVANGLPPITLACLGGSDAVHLSGLRGHRIVINLWASWCGPCRHELPLLQRLHHEAGNKVRVIGVDFQDRSPEAALRLAARAGVTYPLLADPGGALRQDLKVVGLPETVFVDASGKIVATERRQVTSYRELSDLVREHLKVDL